MSEHSVAAGPVPAAVLGIRPDEMVDVVPGQAVQVPGHWVHRSVNVGPEHTGYVLHP